MNGGEVIFKFLGDDKGLKATMGKLGSIGATALKGMAVGTTAVVTGFTAMVTASVKARGEMEQSLGGIETIFKNGADAIIENANNAYKTAGISAQKYMDQATSFGASLRRSLGDNDAEITRYVDMAIKDMADNSAKMGTNIEQIQNAYQGLAKGNATMLDNLKVGYGGTQTEMLKLAQDMGVVSKKIKSFGEMSFDQSILAIHKVQEQLGMAGTAGKEATETLTGSMSMLKASWENFLSGQGDLGKVVDSAGIAFKNIIRIVDEALPFIMENVYDWLPDLINLGKDIISTIGQGIQENLPQILSIAKEIMLDLVNAIIENLPQIIDTGMEILLSLIDGLTEALPDLIPKIVEIMFKIVETLIEHLPEINECGIKIIIALVEGIVKSIPKMIEGMMKINEIIDQKFEEMKKLALEKGKALLIKMAEGMGINMDKVRQKIEFIKEFISVGMNWLKNQAGSWGSDFISRFTTGIAEGLARLRETVSNIANSIKSHLHFSRPDEGPLRDYETWMPDMLEGMSKSLEKAMPSFMSKIHALSDEMAMSLSPSINGGAYSYSPSMSVVVNNNIESDPLGQMINQVKTFSNGAKNDYNYGYGG